MLTIWGRANSSNVKKVLWCAEELKLPYERIDAGGAFGQVNDASYRALNPNGLVPTIQDGDFILWESNTILRYLAAQYGETKLYASTPKERAKIEQWMDWTASSFAAPFRDIVVNLIRAPEAERNKAVADDAIKRCTELFEITNRLLETQPYFGGNHFSIADITIGPIAYMWFEMKLNSQEMLPLQEWYKRLQQRPAFQKIVMIPIT